MLEVEPNACSAYAENLPLDENEFHAPHRMQGQIGCLSVSSVYAKDIGDLRQSFAFVGISANKGAGCTTSGFSVSPAYAQ